MSTLLAVFILITNLNTAPAQPLQDSVQKQVKNNVVIWQEYELTAYCSCKKCCGQWADGITFVGTKATAGYTIAVDPKDIKLGSKVEIKGLGTFVAEDIGGAIKGKRIDIYFDSHKEALDFGRQKGKVRIIKNASDSDQSQGVQ